MVVSEQDVRAALREVNDPELPVSVVDLGLVRRIEVEGATVRVGLTYTSIACPCTDLIRADVEAAVAALDGVERVVVEETLEPWCRQDMSDVARATLRSLAIV
ncbi:MAG: metal-sulfur cluster assembly factor [Nitriliruptorales bacterium]